MNKLQYSYLGVVITINPLNEVWDTVNINTLNSLITQADNFWKRYVPDIFKGMTINGWNEHRADIPRNKYDSSGKITFYGIGDADGISFGGEKRIELNSRAIGTDDELKRTFWHELSHIIDFIQDLGNDPSDIIIPEYTRIEMAVNSGSKSPPFERMAEHGLEMLIGYGRGDFKSVWQIQGMRDMFLIWFKVAQFVRAIRNLNGKVEQKNVSFNYPSHDFNEFGVQFLADYPFQDYWYYCNRDGWFEWMYKDKTWKWVPISNF